MGDEVRYARGGCRRAVSNLPFTEWEDFVSRYFRWKQGEHVAIIGPTGAGKTTVARAILPHREYSVFIATKPRDSIVPELRSDGMHVIKSWGDRHDGMKKVILRPPLRTMADQPLQHTEVAWCLDSVFTQGGWCLCLDELRYVSHDLRLDDEVKLLYLQGRSNKVSLLAGTQRPVWVPREMLSESTHFFLWRMTDRADLKRLRELSGAIDPARVEAELRALPAVRPSDPGYHDVLYVQARSGDMVRTRAPA